MKVLLTWLRLRRAPSPDPAPSLARAHAAEQLAATRERWAEIERVTAAARRAARLI